MPVSTQSGSNEIPKHHKDIYKVFERRLKNFTFTSIPPKLDEWKGSNIVNDVFDDEYNVKNFKSSEEQMLWRLETWIDKCRIQEYDENGLPIKNVTGKFHSAKRFRKSTTESALVKVRSFSLGRAFTRSSENLQKHDINIEDNKSVKKELFYVARETKTATKMASSKSTSNLLEATEYNQRDPSLDRRSVRSMDINHSTKSNNKPKLYKLFAFAGKLKSSKKQDNDKTKRTNRQSISFEIDEEIIDNNNTQSPNAPKVRPSILDIVGAFSTKEKSHNTEEGDVRDGGRRSSSISRSRSLGGRHSHDSQPAQTLFKSRQHNDSVKRVKAKIKTIKQPGNGHTGQVFYDPQKHESPVRTEICDV